jgi:hypothetical protein
LRSPSQAFEIRIFTTSVGTRFRFFRFTLSAAIILFTLLHLLGFLTISFGDCCFSWSCDGILLVTMRQYDVDLPILFRRASAAFRF